MCGLVGAIGTSFAINYRVFEQLLMIDSVRGLDSTGVLAVFRDWSFRVKKSMGPPFNLLFREDYIQQVEKNKEPTFVLMGHNRAATRGKLVHKNAHPFIHHPIILAHNGTLTSTHLLHKDFLNPYDTDSEAICAHLAKNTVQDTWKAIRGAAALSWWDIRDNSLNLITNGDRPLHVAMSKSETNLYWASEAWMLQGILGRHRVDHQPIQSVNADYHLKFTWDYKNKKINSSSSKLEGQPVPFAYPPSGYHGGYHASDKSKANKNNLLEFKKEENKPKPTSQILYDPINKQDFVWVQGKKHYLLSFSDEICPLPDKEEGLSNEDEVLAQQLLKTYPSCGWCNASFDEESILKGKVVAMLDACICEACVDDPDAQDFVVAM